MGKGDQSRRHRAEMTSSGMQEFKEKMDLPSALKEFSTTLDAMRATPSRQGHDAEFGIERPDTGRVYMK
nr:hypothetical protein [uncultured Cupriavidus sp.]